MAAEVAIASAVTLLGDLLIKKINILRGVEREVELLKEELKRMQSFLKDANNKQADDERVRNWISDIREVAHDARDAIELFVNKVERKGRLGRFSSFPKHVHYVNKVGAEMKSIKIRLEAINRSRETYGITNLGVVVDTATAWRPQIESRRRLAPWKNDEHVVGMKDDVEKLLRESILDEGKKGLSVAVVEGMGGIGKSTLAQKIYSHPDVLARFECRAWVVVSSEFKPQETMKELILQLPRSEEDKQTLRELLEMLTKGTPYLQAKLQEMLYKQLQGRKYFIVLDDVWEKEHFEYLRSVFPDDQDKTSRLLITSRNKVIAKYSEYALEMKVLDLDESWELFLKKAFVNNSDNECPEELEHIGRKIVEKCNGLPLAISVVGGLLLETQSQGGWEEILDQMNSHSGKAESSISTILELSYQNLSPRLKSCFLCLATFKEDATIPVKRLVHIWTGHGLIQREGRRTVEEIARGYLDDLINRNMVQIKDLTLDDRVRNCQLHDLLRDVCLGKAKEEIGFQMVKGEEGNASESSYKPRHRIVCGENLNTLSLDQNNHLRSLFLLNNNTHIGGFDHYLRTPFRYWKSFKLLEILYLDGIGLQRFPHSFRSLVGLKYLRIRCGSSEILKLPNWLDQLKKLEIIDTRSEDVELPNVALKMDSLRYLSALHVRGVTSIENWKNIETLKYIGLDDLMRCSSGLIEGCPVRELGIFLDGERAREVDELRRVRALLEEKMENLVKLQLWDMGLFIKPAIIPHLANLTKLKLRGGMRTCPDVSMFPPNLSHLTLVENFLQQDPMAELGKLPKLLYLKLSEYACLEERMQVLQDGFPCLKALSLRGMYFLRGIDIQQGGMPHLKQLRISHCPALQINNLPQHLIISPLHTSHS